MQIRVTHLHVTPPPKKEPKIIIIKSICLGSATECLGTRTGREKRASKSRCGGAGVHVLKLVPSRFSVAVARSKLGEWDMYKFGDF